MVAVEPVVAPRGPSSPGRCRRRAGWRRRPPRASAIRSHHVADVDLAAPVVERPAGQLAHQPPVPVDQRRRQLGDHHLGVGGDPLQRGPRREPQPHAAHQDGAAVARLLQRQLGQRVLRAVLPARHQHLAAVADHPLVVAAGQHHLGAVRRQRLLDRLPGLHAPGLPQVAGRGYAPGASAGAREMESAEASSTSAAPASMRPVSRSPATSVPSVSATVVSTSGMVPTATSETRGRSQ